jgi:group I intron endonuclease
MQERARMIVYKIRNLLNGKVYIGQTKRSLAARITGHFGKGSSVGEDMKKLGKENFDVSILDFADTQEELDKLERFWIDFYSANTYNIMPGGSPDKKYMKAIAAMKKSTNKGKKYRKKKPLPHVKRLPRLKERISLAKEAETPQKKKDSRDEERRFANRLKLLRAEREANKMVSGLSVMWK